jgi:hypothetical protein
MADLRLRLLMFSCATVAITLAFGNCSKVKFEIDEQASLTRLNTSGGVLINNGAPFTTSLDVDLSVLHNSADEMFITEDPACETGGQWERYSANKPWRLAAANVEGRVFAKFRENETMVESGCFEDAIIHDNIPPVLAITSPVNSFINAQQALINFTATDSGSGVDEVECLLDNASRVSCRDSHNRMGLTEGPHALQVTATDRAGNVAIPVSSSFVVDLTKPILVLNSTPPKVTANIKSDFQFSGTDALSGVDKFECKKSAASLWEACVSPFSFNASEGAQSAFFRVYDRAGNASADVKYDWSIDQTAPSVTITKTPKQFSNDITGQFEFVGTDGGQPLVRYECSVDASAFVACSSPYGTAALAEGSHNFAVRGYDDANNVSAPASYSWFIDRTAPSVRITSAPAAVTPNANASIAFTGTDAGSGVDFYECQTNNAGFARCTTPSVLNNLVDGNYVYQVRAIDRAGNISAAASATFRVDSKRPEITITKTPLAVTKDLPAIFEFIAVDPGGEVAGIECAIDSAAAFMPCTSPKEYAGLVDGVHNFYVRAIDKAGLVSDVKSYSWLLDRLGPAINIGVQPAAVLASGSPSNIQFIVTDDGVGLQSVACRLNGANFVCSENFSDSIANLPIGYYVFEILAQDKLGNASSKSIQWRVDQVTMLVSQDVNVSSNSKADVLVVVDNSGSMSEEQANMASRFGTFLDILNGLDWQVGIVTTDVSADEVRKDGRFLEISGNAGQFILSSAMPLADAKTQFGATIQRPSSEGSGYEQGIRATYRAVERAFDAASVTASAPNRSFFRSGAALSVLVVTDADETSPAGTLISNTPAGLVSLIQNKFGSSKQFSFHSIIVKPGDRACARAFNNEGPGNAYASLSSLTGGVIGSVCAADYSSQLTAMGRAVVDAVRSVTLTCQPLDTDANGVANISVVTANGSAAPAYTVNGLTLTFAQNLPVGVNKLSYTCLK